MEDLEVENSLDEEKSSTRSVNYYLETVMFTVLAVAFELFIIAIYSVWMGYPDFEEAEHEFEFFYNLVRDISVMIFFGFAFLMVNFFIYLSSNKISSYSNNNYILYMILKIDIFT